LQLDELGGDAHNEQGKSAPRDGQVAKEPEYVEAEEDQTHGAAQQLVNHFERQPQQTPIGHSAENCVEQIYIWT